VPDHHLLVFQAPRLEPFLDQAEDTLIADPVLEKADQG
jgi:hypothetical protein